MIDMFWFRPYYWFNVLITSVSTLNINEWHIGNYLSHLLKLMKPNLANHNLFYLVIKLCDVIQWENPKSMLSCKLSNSFVDQFPFCSNTFIFQVFSNLLYLHLFIFLMSIWTTWMLKLLHNYDDLVKSSPQLYCLIHRYLTSGFNPLPCAILNAIHYQQCNHNIGPHVNYAQWHISLVIWMRHVHIIFFMRKGPTSSTS
jgi:hypothetical protein